MTSAATMPITMHDIEAAPWDAIEMILRGHGVIWKRSSGVIRISEYLGLGAGAADSINRSGDARADR